MGGLDGRVAVVTGAAQGIGAAIVRRLSADGARVAALDLNEEGAQKLVDEVGGNGLGLACDVSNREQVDAAIDCVASELGSVDILVNNAGVTRDNLLFKMSDEDFDTVFGIHVRGAFLCTRAAQKYMVEKKYGKIVMMSSRSALGNRGQTNYSSAKAALQGMVRAVSIELGPFGINVNAIAPGHIETAMTKATAERMGIDYEDMQKRTIERQPIKRVGKPEDVANLCAFLVSEDSSYITGQTIYITGGPGGS
jgi:3-oxoacyl-[acyl-carrier protein] reductase